jgi:hypothetical protein
MIEYMMFCLRLDGLGSAGVQVNDLGLHRDWKC